MNINCVGTYEIVAQSGYRYIDLQGFASLLLCFCIEVKIDPYAILFEENVYFRSFPIFLINYLCSIFRGRHNYNLAYCYIISL